MMLGEMEPLVQLRGANGEVLLTLCAIQDKSALLVFDESGERRVELGADKNWGALQKRVVSCHQCLQDRIS